MHKITLIPGDGVGPEVTDAARRCIEATGVEIAWEEVQAGAEVLALHQSGTGLTKYKTPLPPEVLDSIKRNKICLKGPITTPIGEGFRSVNVQLRQQLDLYVCLRVYKSYPGVRSRYTDLDLVVVRENTEDLYAGIEFSPGSEQARKIVEISKGKIRENSAISIKPISEFASRRIVKYAFEYARKYNRKKVTAVTKANIMKYTDGLFLETARDVARDYPEIEYEERLVDNMCMQLVQKPELYDVLVLPNLYGDIISDLCAGLVGGLGVAPGANIGKEIGVFEATHGSAPKYKGMNKVNPTGMILSGVMMLRYLGEETKAQELENAVSKVIAEGKEVTYDLKPNRDDPTAVGTKEMADAIIKRL